jgi:hypothetical protein
LSTSNSDFASEMLVSAIPVPVSSEEKQSVMEIGKVNLDGNVVDPWCYSVRIPIRKKLVEISCSKELDEVPDHSGYIVDLNIMEFDVINLLNRPDQPFPST